MIYDINNYNILIRDIINFINDIKEKDHELSLVDIILEFCFKYDVDIELIGDAISTDAYFKSFIEKDCELHKIFKSNITSLDW